MARGLAPCVLRSHALHSSLINQHNYPVRRLVKPSSSFPVLKKLSKGQRHQLHRSRYLSSFFSVSPKLNPLPASVLARIGLCDNKDGQRKLNLRICGSLTHFYIGYPSIQLDQIRFPPSVISPTVKSVNPKILAAVVSQTPLSIPTMLFRLFNLEAPVASRSHPQ
jgi:hypothetical protein